MRAEQKLYKDGNFISEGGDVLTGNKTLVLAFGDKNL
jgi:hypothetical protein